MERPADAVQVGTNPADVAVDEKANRVYVVATAPGTGQVYVGGTNGVAVIDTAHANQVTRVGDFSTTTVVGLAVSPENGDVYLGGGGAATSEVAYIAAGTSSAVRIPFPPGTVGTATASNGMDFSFNAALHEVYLAKSGNGGVLSPDIGLLAIS
ncbi:hypothetical protein [Streptomyces sp. NBC_00503]|uniref:hypothetical protein n=1 Tax=Streptomyces sp. NBC_00503 TaxID=2903659 RepID=UPI002E800CE8|nr:hypothetical protein [Streptomyces sp. NBC_00503]WUD79286.1 hypothetical protein OG490_01125 [Streptomyces sp. NBC_00503]